MIRLALLRHGPTTWNEAGRIQGSSDIALSETGRTTLRGLALPAPWNDCALWSSPLGRASETARLVSGREPKIAEALREMNWGEWEGKRGEDLLADPDSGFRHIEDWGWDYRPPGGESPRDVRNRLLPWLADQREDAVLVCHIGIMRVLLAIAQGWDFDGPAPFRVKRNRLFLLNFDNSRVTRETEETPRLIPRGGAS